MSETPSAGRIPASINSVKASLDQNLEQEGVRAQSSSSKADSRFSVDQHMVMIYVFLIVMSCIIGGVGGLGFMTTMSLNVLERRREMGVLRAIGASPSVVWLIVAAEGMNFLFEPIGLLIWLAVSICLGAVASFLPAWHASRRPVREAIGYE